jgi:glycosyltransferase involved in cell wall biosynthesis
MPKVSVVIPAYNAAKFISAAIDSVLSQSYRDFEVIVIDDGSTDETAKILRQYEGRIWWLSLPQNAGQTRATNHGIRMATGEYLTYLDADDVYVPSKLEVQVKYLDEHLEVDAVYGDRYYVTPKGTSIIRSRPIDKFLLLQRCYVPRPTVMHRRSCLEMVGWFDDKINGSEDWDMWVRMSECCNMAYINQPFFEYRIHGTNDSFIRHKRLNHYRWTRMVILQNAWERRGRPRWLRIMVINAKIQWLIGRVPILGEKSPRFWAVADRVQWAFERFFLRRFAGC